MGPPGRPGRRRKPGRRPLRPPKPDRPAPAQAFRLAARPFGSTARSSRAAASRIWAGSRLGGRPAPSRQQRQKGRRGPERVADGEAEVTQRGCVGVEAQDLGGGRGALQRKPEREAPRRRAGRRAGQASRSASAGAGGEQGIALPCPSARPRPGRDRSRRLEGLAVPGFSLVSTWLARASRAAQRTRSSGSGGGSASSSRIGANHSAHDEFLCGALSRRLARNPPRLSWRWRCPISLPYQTLGFQTPVLKR